MATTALIIGAGSGLIASLLVLGIFGEWNEQVSRALSLWQGAI